MHEVLPRPAFGHRAGGDGGRGVHEHHHEEEQPENRRVGDRRAQEESLGAEDPVFPGNHDALVEHGGARTERRVPAGWDRSVEPVAPPERKAVDPEAQATQRVDHEVHGDGVRRVLGAAHAGLDHRETCLHEHDEEARDHGPHHVDGEQVVGDAVVEIRHSERAGDISLAVTGGSGPHACGATRRIGPGGGLSVRVGAGEVGRQRWRRRRCRRGCRRGWFRRRVGER